MNVPVNLITWISAILPIIVLLLLMIKFQWGAAHAAPIGLAIAMISAIFIFKSDIKLIYYEILKGLWSSFTVLLVVWPAILLFEIVNSAKAFDAFRYGIKSYISNELLLIMSIGWVFVSFLQGITGFGVPVAVGAPLLVGIGVNPIWAVMIPLLGHAWGNTFGTLGVAWNALVLQTGIIGNLELIINSAIWAAIFIWIWNAITGISIAWFYGKKEALKKALPAIIVISTIQGGGQLFLVRYNQTLSCFIPSCLALISVILLSKTSIYRDKWSIEKSKVMSRQNINTINEKKFKMTTNQAFMPYYILTIITLVVLLVPPINGTLNLYKIGFSFPETSTKFGYVNAAVDKFAPLSPFVHAGIFLILSSVFGYMYYSKKGYLKTKNIFRILHSSLAKTTPSAIAVITFIIMSRIMSGSGQTLVLAEGISTYMGRSYIIFAPIIGMLGSFMTSSNMASNILFGEFQLTSASILNLDVASILGAQTAGGAIGNTICPGNIILGTTTSGILGSEGIILKKILPITIIVALIVGIILVFSLLII